MRVRFTAGLPWFGWATVALCASVFMIISGVLFPLTASAATPTDEGFSLQVSPSPLVETVKPGQSKTLDLQIRNTSAITQQLKMGLRSFTVDETTGDVKLSTSVPADVATFVSFSNPTFSLEAGQIMTQHVLVKTPSSAGFTYSFAITISQQNPPKAQLGSSSVRGSVAVFTLLTVDKPGAKRLLNLEEFAVGKHVYQYLPATVSVKLKNNGNTLAQPSGNIFIQHGSDDKTPLATIPLNQTGGYILPGSSRILTTSWNDGFPHYQSTTDSNGKTTTKLSWAGGDFTKLRFGKYTAKLVAVYNDGERDVPITAETTFWIIPWWFLLAGLLVILIIGVGIWTIFRKSTKALKRGVKRDGTAKS